MDKVIGSKDDCFFYEQNAEGKYDIMITPRYGEGKKYRTGFIFDSVKLMNGYILRVSQTDSEGNKKYGVIVINGYSKMFHPCKFDKIKPYKGVSVRAYIGEEEYVIDHYGAIESLEFHHLRHPQND